VGEKPTLQSKVDEFIFDELGLAPKVTDERATSVIAASN